MKFELPEELKFISNGRLPQKASLENMSSKLCIITGATSGVGYESALSLARAGARLIIVVRSKEKAESLCREIKFISGLDTDYYIADFADLNQVREVAEKINSTYKKIDVLINNAGVHMTTREITSEGFEMAFCVNHLSSFLLTSILIKRLIQSSPSRIIQVNSEGHRFNGLRIDDLNWEKRYYRGLQGYGASKTAQLMTVWEMNDLLKNSGVTINAMHPGAVRSNIGKNNGLLYRLYSKYIIQPLLSDPKIAGDAIYYLASSKDLKSVSGKFYNLTNEEIPASHAMDRELGLKIFNISKKLTGLDEGNYYEI